MDYDPELSLRLGQAQDIPPTNTNAGSGKAEQQKQTITIFYNGQICVCDVTELQARAIITTAKRAMEDRDAKKNDTTDHQLRGRQYKQRVVSQALPSSPQLLNSGLSMKRSLQRFLQKRKTRITTSIHPYENRRQMLSSSASFR